MNVNRFEQTDCKLLQTPLRTEKTAAGNNRYGKCGFLSFAQETASLSCVFVETFGIFTYICAGRLWATI